jgi:diadenosine tetraphosphate (Ap4A) HIT family hydrolase
MPWSPHDQWTRLVDGSACPMCKDMHLAENEFSLLVEELGHSYVRLPRNQYARGWLIVVLKRHACELFELTKTELHGYWDDVAVAAKALERVLHPLKINYMIYGNLVPHVHCHLLPRFSDHEPTPQLFMDIEKHPTFLASEEYHALIGELRAQLRA